ncbi:MAG: glycosyltransferase family 4 protein [Nitrospira sp.]|nr:glycosyltransferase family 4 protein [Nitrospira sp.]
MDLPYGEKEPYFLSVGRTFRDYDTLLAAFSKMKVPLRIIASRSNINASQVSPNVEVEYDLPGPQMLERMARCLAVVIPLQVRSISIGQSVLLQAMTLQKPVIVTQVPGTEDYIEHMKSGIFVPPNDSEAIRDAVLLLVENPELRGSLGLAARERVKNLYLPQHYADSVANLLC